MTDLALIVGVCVVVVSTILSVMLIMLARRKLRGAAMAVIRESWKHAEKQENPTLRVIEADKVLDEALKLLGFQGTLGEKLKKAGPRFSDVDSVWSAHKLRNTLVHELQKKPSDKEVKTAMTAFKKALTDLGM